MVGAITSRLWNWDEWLCDRNHHWWLSHWWSFWWVLDWRVLAVFTATSAKTFFGCMTLLSVEGKQPNCG